LRTALVCLDVSSSSDEETETEGAPSPPTPASPSDESPSPSTSTAEVSEDGFKPMTRSVSLKDMCRETADNEHFKDYIYSIKR